MVLDSQLLKAHFTDMEEYNSVVRAFQTLERLGVFDLACRTAKLRVVEQFELNETDLARKIYQVQQTNRVMLSLSEMARGLEERKHNNES